MNESDDKISSGDSSGRGLFRQMLNSGQRIAFSGEEPDSDREIPAEWVVNALRSGRGMFLENALIIGPFNAQNLVAKRQIGLKGCIVRDSIADFSHTKFEQRADFSGTHFAQGANFARCSFDGDLMLEGCRFSGLGILLLDAEIKRALMAYHLSCDPGTQANFHRCHIYSIAKFPGSVFHGEADFNSCRFDGQVTFSGASFVGSTGFGGCVFRDSALFCGGTEQPYPGTVFCNDVTFVSARFEGQAAFQGAMFKKSVTFNLATFHGFAYFTSLPYLGVPPTTFEGKVDFVTTHFFGQANFQGVTFQDSVSFNSAVIDGTANFGIQLNAVVRCTFVGPADFANVKCESASDFRGAVFHQQADFRNAKFAESAEFTGETSRSVPPAIFHGPALFGNALFGKNADFRRVVFDAKASFVAAKIEENALFSGLDSPTDQGASFAEEALFSLTRVGGIANFRKATFRKDTSFSGAEVRGPVLFEGATFRATAIFSLCRLRDVANFSRVEFLGDLNLNEAKITALLFSAPVATIDRSNQFKSNVDLRGCTYDRIDVNRRELLSHIAPYERQPFVQLERAARSAGDDADANAIYLFRRRAERLRQWKRKEFGSWLFSAAYWLLANYGVKPYQLIVLPLLLLALAVFVFSQPQAVRRADPTLGSEVKSKNPVPTILDGETFTPVGLAARVSLRIFLPVEVPLASGWEPSNLRIAGPLRSSDFAASLKIAGWILVPLGVAALTGLLRRKQSASLEEEN